MLRYDKTVWKDHIQELSNLFNFRDIGSGKAEISLIPGEIHQQGTPVNSRNLNKIENIILDIVNMVNDHEIRLRNIETFMIVSLGLEANNLNNNKFFEDFTTLNDVELTNGIYNPENKTINI